MILQEILYKVRIRSVQGSSTWTSETCNWIHAKWARVPLFIAVKGTHADGHQFIESAAAAQPAAILCEKMPASFRSRHYLYSG